MKDTSLSGAFQTSYPGQSQSISAHFRKSLVSADDENEEKSRKRGRWEQQQQADDSSKCFINFDFNRTIIPTPPSYPPPPPPPDHLLSGLTGTKLPLPADSPDLELSIVASATSSSSMEHLKPSNILGGAFTNGSSYGAHQRSLSPHHNNGLIARLLAAASSRDPPSSVQAFHALNHGQLGMPLLQYTSPQGKPCIEQQGAMSRVSNQGILTKVNPSTYVSQQCTLRDDIMPNYTTMFKPYNTMINDTLTNPNPYRSNSRLCSSIESNDIKEGELLKKVAMQKYVKVVMEGRSIERKVCLEECDSYESFAKALFDMYGTQDIDKGLNMNGSHTPTNMHDAIPGYKIAYRDHEGDLLLAGDLPWREFIQVAKEIKIMHVTKPKQRF